MTIDKLKSTARAAMFAVASLGAFAAPVSAASVDPVDVDPVDADLMFVIDKSGSMGGEFSFLSSAIGDFLSRLASDSRIGTVQAGLVQYTSGAQLVQGLTSSVETLQNAFGGVRTSGSRENAYNAIEVGVNKALDDPNLQTGSVRSIILITDENTDDYSIESKDEIASLLETTGFLNNIIYEFGDSDADLHFDSLARPAGAIFDIDEFRFDRIGFFNSFADAKLSEIIDAGGGGNGDVAYIPLPAAGWLLIGGIGGLVALRRKKAA